MKKEKKVRTYQRRTKSGKTITVRAHTASYEAAEKAKEAAKKKGAGDEISERKKKNWELPMDEFLKKMKEERLQKRDDEEETKKVEDKKPKKKSEKKTEKKSPAKKNTVGTGTNGQESKKKTTTKKMVAKAEASEPAFTKDEFKEWYRGTGSAADKKVAKALRKQLGRSGYRKFEDEAIDNYTSRGHLSMFKRVSGGSSSSAKTKSADASTKTTPKVSKPTLSKKVSKQITPEQLKKEAAMGSTSTKLAFNIGGATYGKSEYDLFRKGGKEYAVNRKTGKLATDSMTAKIMAFHKKVLKDNKDGVAVNYKKYAPKDTSAKSSVKGSLGITKNEFKEWYSDTDGSSPSFKKVNKALKKFYGKTWDEVENRAVFGGKTQYQDMLKEIGSRFSTSPTTGKTVKKRSVGTGTNGPELKNKKQLISEQSLNSKGFKTFRMPQVGTLYLGKKGKGAYIKFKGKKSIQKADIDDYGDFITGHNGLTKSQKKQLSSLGYTEHEEY